MTRRCQAGHATSEKARAGASCGSCRREQVAAAVALVCPDLSFESRKAAIDAVTTSSAVLRDIASAINEAGPQILSVGAPPVVGRLLNELRARGASLAVPSCAICGRTGLALIRDGRRGLCGRCRSHELAVTCARCEQVRVVYGRTESGEPLCFACAPRPRRRCALCGRERPLARRGRDGEGDICVSCYRLPTATCTRCGALRPCNFVAEGHPVCKYCSPRRSLVCVHCGESRPPGAWWPEGPVCGRCYQAAMRRRGICSGCGAERRLVSPPGPEARLCCDCGGVAPLPRCARCGTEDRLVLRSLCARCSLAERAAQLLASPGGEIASELVPVHDALVAARQPYSALNWLRKGAGAAVLREIVAGNLAISHDALDAHPNRRAADYLRQVLVANGVLAARNEALVRLEAWANERIGEVSSAESRRHLQGFVTWEVLRRLRRRAESGEVVATASARVVISAAVDLLEDLAATSTPLNELDQGRVDRFVLEGPPGRRQVRSFLAWAAARRLVGRLELAPPSAGTGATMDDDERWGLVAKLLSNDTIELTDRVAGCLVLLYGLQLSRIVTLDKGQVLRRDGEVRLRLGGSDELLLPQPLADLITALAETGRRYVGIGSPPETAWLFPGLLPGRHLGASQLGERLRRHGVATMSGRRAALLHLAARLPAAVLADLLNLHPTTAVHWANIAGGDWSAYAAEVSRTRGYKI